MHVDLRTFSFLMLQPHNTNYRTQNQGSAQKTRALTAARMSIHGRVVTWQVRSRDSSATSTHLQGSVEMFGSFDFHGHTCIVFEVLGKSVFDFLKDNGYTAFPLGQIQRIADDMISALTFLHGNSMTISW